MTSFNLDDVTRALKETSVAKVEERGISFEGNNLKLNNAIDAKPLVDAVLACKELGYLNLAGNTLGVEAAEALAKALEKHPEFKRALWKDLFTGRLKEEIPKALQYLGNGLVKANARLTELDLSDNAFGPIGVKGLASLLQSSSCYNLKELRLNNNGLGITGGKLLASALMNCYNCSKAQGTPLALRVFIAGRNRLENEGAKALAQVFETIGTFEEISMPQNGIYHIGITALSEAFTKNPNLQTLNLNDNTLGAKGSRAIAKALRTLQNLNSLNLGDCLLRTKGAELIAEALAQTHPNLEELNLESNEIRSNGGVAIARACANKSHLTRVLLDENQFGEDAREQIKTILSDAGHSDALGSFENDEDASEGEEEDNENEEDTEEEEEDDDDDELEISIDEIKEEVVPVVSLPFVPVDSVSAAEFLAAPSAETFLGMGYDRTSILLAAAKGHPEDQFLEIYVPILMKVSALAGHSQPEVSQAALETSDALYKELFTWSQFTQQSSLLNNSLLVHLGLIKSEDKKYKPTWNLDGCYVAVEAALKKTYFPTTTKDTLKVFLGRCNEASTSTTKSKLISALNS